MLEGAYIYLHVHPSSRQILNPRNQKLQFISSPLGSELAIKRRLVLQVRTLSCIRNREIECEGRVWRSSSLSMFSLQLVPWWNQVLLELASEISLVINF
jgi:hypothetical protein